MKYKIIKGLPNELNTSTTSNNSVTTNNSSSTELVVNCRRRRKQASAADRDTNKFNRLSLGAITTPGQLSSFVFGKIKSLWSADETSANVGLNLLAGMINSYLMSCVYFYFFFIILSFF